MKVCLHFGMKGHVTDECKNEGGDRAGASLDVYEAPTDPTQIRSLIS